MYQGGVARRIARPGRPPAGPGRYWALRDAVISVATAVVVAGAAALVLAAFFADPAQFNGHPLRFLGWCAGFAGGATAVSVVGRTARHRPVPLVLVVCGVAMWALLPATAVLAFYAAQLVNVFVLVTLAPLALATTAWVVMLRGRVARGAALLLIALAGTAGAAAIGIPALTVAVWLPIVGWHVVLALATVAALAWDLRHGQS
jgi:hypothetical protein